MNILFGKIKKFFSDLNKKELSITPDPIATFVPEHLPEPELPLIVSHKKRKLGIVVGHEGSKPGAVVTVPIKSNEYFVNRKIAQKIKDECTKRNIDCVLIYRDGVGVSGAYAKAKAERCDAVIELHFNAFNRKAFGTETLCTKSSDDRAFAKIVQDHMVKCFERTGSGNRGVKVLSASDRGAFSVHSFPSGANCLVEPFFSDNPEEVQLYLRKEKEYPIALVDAFVAWCESIGM